MEQPMAESKVFYGALTRIVTNEGGGHHAVQLVNDWQETSRRNQIRIF